MYIVCIYIYIYIYIYICVKNIVIFYVEFKKNNYSPFHSPIFISILELFFDMFRGRIVTCKMNGDRQGGQKLEVSSKHTSWMTPKSSAATKIYDMLIFNLTCSLSAYNLNSDTNNLHWPFLRIILNFCQANNTFFIQTESYQQSAEKNGSGIKKVLRKWKIMVNTRGNINTLVSRV